MIWSLFFFFKQKTAYEMRISDWSSYVCSSDLLLENNLNQPPSHTGLSLAIPFCPSIPPAVHCTNLRPSTPVRAIARCRTSWTISRGNRREEVASSAVQIGRASCRERVCQYV